MSNAYKKVVRISKKMYYENKHRYFNTSSFVYRNWKSTLEGQKMKLIQKKIIQDKSVYWDLSIPKNHNYVLENGLVVHNCRSSGFQLSVSSSPIFLQSMKISLMLRA